MVTARGIRAGRAFVELFADDSKLVRGLRRVRNLGLKVAGLGTAVLAPLAGAAKAFSGMGDQVAKMAKRTGLSVETLSELKFVASQTGTEFESLEMAFRRMQRSIYDARRGLSTVKDALPELNDHPDDEASRRQGFSRRLHAIGHLFEAEDESQQWPDLHNAIRQARKAYQAEGEMPNWDAPAQLLDNLRGVLRETSPAG